jgi:hypothetical protein
MKSSPLPPLLVELRARLLLDDARLTEVADALPAGLPDDEILTWLVRHGLLTAIQADRVRSDAAAGLGVGPNPPPPAAPPLSSLLAPRSNQPAQTTPEPRRPERRIKARRTGNVVPVLLAVDPSRDQPLRGWVLNRTSDGLGLLVEEPLEVGSEWHVRPTSREYEPHWFPVKVIACARERLRWRVGCQFIRNHGWAALRGFG